MKNGTPAVLAVPRTFARDGSTLVEWGGFFLDEPESDALPESVPLNKALGKAPKAKTEKPFRAPSARKLP